MDEAELQLFRIRARVHLLEEIVLRGAVLEPVLNRQIPIESSRQGLKDWLALRSLKIAEAYGRHLGEPAETALYADEVDEIVRDMQQKIELVTPE